MRSLADEFKTGTMELLSTKPITWWQIVWGKFWAAVLIVLIALLPTLVYYVAMAQLSTSNAGLDNGSIIGSYLGLFLLGSTFTATGIWALPITSNAVIAFLVAIFTCYIFYNGFDVKQSTRLSAAEQIIICRWPVSAITITPLAVGG